jgi:fumarate hydratase subunit alpha
MLLMNKTNIIEKVKKTLIEAASSYREDQIKAFKSAISNERNPRAKWILENMLENAYVANKNKTPLCDDTGIPHVILEVGKNKSVSGEMLNYIHEGISEGLRKLPGRPMAVKGNSIERIEQSSGLYDDPSKLEPPPIIIKEIDEDVIRLYILMQGGGPEIRGKTYRIFHQHSINVVVDEIVEWAKEEVSNLGCTPCVPAIGIGRTHFEAASLMLEAMAKGNFGIQNNIEKEITEKINKSNVGPLGLKGNTTALATFLNIGPQRASGVRIVCLRLCCCVEPRKAVTTL